MRIRIPEYTGGFRVFSFAFDQETKEDLLSEGIDTLYIQSDSAVIYPENEILTQDISVLNQVKGCNNYDVFGISDNGSMYRYYDDSSTENVFFITETCNSNCIMCPSPEYSRRRGNGMEINDLITIARHIPSDTPHITVTGGEPFMAGKDIFRLLDYCKGKFRNTEFLILTNARIFAVKTYCELLRDTIPNNTIIGIPIHGSCSEIHDSLTRSDGSFRQTMTGLRRLQSLRIPLEIRIVVCRPNLKDLSSIARLIISQLSMVNHVSIMAMEMTGNAHKNAQLLWVPYRESFRYIRTMINLLIEAGIDVKLYNYPLCTVDKEYRLLCAKSISSWKIRFAPICDTCFLREACGGVFAGSYNLEWNELGVVE